MVATAVGLAMLLSPAVYYLARRFSKKILVFLSLLALAFIFLTVFQLGNFSLSNVLQAYFLAVLLSVPISILGILPPVILAELTHVDAYKTKENKEATFFAIRSFFIQLGQTLGIVIFTILIGLNADEGLGVALQNLFPNIAFEELGIRLSGIAGFILCFMAAIIFLFFNEKKLNTGLREIEKQG